MNACTMVDLSFTFVLGSSEAPIKSPHDEHSWVNSSKISKDNLLSTEWLESAGTACSLSMHSAKSKYLSAYPSEAFPIHIPTTKPFFVFWAASLHQPLCPVRVALHWTRSLWRPELAWWPPAVAVAISPAPPPASGSPPSPSCLTHFPSAILLSVKQAHISLNTAHSSKSALFSLKTLFATFYFFSKTHP